MNRIRLTAVAAIVATAACARNIPVAPEPIDHDAFVDYQPALLQQVDACIERLWTLRNKVKKAYHFSDTMTLLGGGVATAGSAVAASITATGKTGDSGPAKGTAVTSAVVGGVGGIVALASKLTDGPDVPNASFDLSEKHWLAGYTVILQSPVAELQPGKPLYRYAMARLVACASANPSPTVEAPPAGVDVHVLPSPPPPAPDPSCFPVDVCLPASAAGVNDTCKQIAAGLPGVHPSTHQSTIYVTNSCRCTEATCNWQNATVLDTGGHDVFVCSCSKK